MSDVQRRGFGWIVLRHGRRNCPTDDRHHSLLKGDPVTLEDLARQAVAVLDAQRRYFNGHCQPDLIVSKRLEHALRQTCESILNPSLFEDGQRGGPGHANESEKI